MLANLQHAGRTEKLDDKVDHDAVIEHNKTQVA